MFAKYSVGAQRAAPAPARHSQGPKTTLHSAGINRTGSGPAKGEYDRSRKNKKSLHSIVSSTCIPPTPAKRTEKPNPACYNSNGNSARERPSWRPNDRHARLRQKAEKRLRAATVRERFPPLRAQSEQKMWGQATWNKKAGDKRRGARLQTCRVAIRGDMSLLASPRSPCPAGSAGPSPKEQTKSNEKQPLCQAV